MRFRSYTWRPLSTAPATRGGNPDQVHIGRSDQWRRVHVALAEASAPRRAYRTPAVVAPDDWHDATVDVNAARTDVLNVRHVAQPRTTTASGLVNPDVDSRGRIPVTYRGHWIAPHEAPTECFVTRLRDAIAFAVPIEPAAAIYGLGEKTGTLDKRGTTWIMWNTDDPDHRPHTDPLYQSIPVAHVVDDRGVTTVFVDSQATVYVDAGQSRDDLLILEVYDPVATLYVTHSADLKAAVRSYAELTGTMPLPPLWALGFQQCRYSYVDQARVLEVARTMREHRVPCDVLYLDIHYMDGYRVFTWDRSRFPDPAAMVRELDQLGFRVVVIVDPGVKVDPDYHVYATGRAAGVFLNDNSGAQYRGAVWPGPAVYPDFFRDDTRAWWADHCRALLEIGIAGIWNDMNEPADFTGSCEQRVFCTVPDDATSSTAAGPLSLERIHNGYAGGMNRAARQAFTQYRPQQRGFVLTRAGYAGGQRDAAVWTGDNESCWEHLALGIPMYLNMGLSGLGFVGGDVGGFQDNADPELYCRWVEASFLNPLMRAHSALHTTDHEPWSFGAEVLDRSRRLIELRYRLLPYLYTLFAQASRTGDPVIGPLIYHFPRDRRLANRADGFMIGPALYLAPVREPGVGERAVYLPAGRWYDVWTGAVHDHAQGEAILVAAPLGRPPLFVRGGTVVPFQRSVQSTGEDTGGQLCVLVAPDADGVATGTCYRDDGEGWAYRDNGEYLCVAIESDAARVRLTTEHHGAHAYVTRVAAVLPGATDAPHGVFDGAPRDTRPWDGRDRLDLALS